MASPTRFKLASIVAALTLAGLLAVNTISSRADARTNPQKFAPASPAIAAAETIARAYWGADPCGGQVTVEWFKQAADINAMSTWSTIGTDPYGNPDANSGCVVDLNPDARFGWAKLCTVIVHEFGHLTGRPHDSQPGRLMSEVYTTPLPECTTAVAKAAAHGTASLSSLMPALAPVS